jgi:hypothetical protein
MGVAHMSSGRVTLNPMLDYVLAADDELILCRCACLLLCQGLTGRAFISATATPPADDELVFCDLMAVVECPRCSAWCVI